MTAPRICCQRCRNRDARRRLARHVVVWRTPVMATAAYWYLCGACWRGTLRYFATQAWRVTYESRPYSARSAA